MSYCDICGASAAYVLKDGELRCVRHFDRVPTVTVEPVESTGLIVVSMMIPFGTGDVGIHKAFEEARSKFSTVMRGVRGDEG